MKKKIIVLSVLLLVMLTLGDPFKNSRFKVVVLDEQAQRPLSGIKLRGGFTDRYPRWENACVDHSVDMQTDVNGICRFAGRTNCGEAYFIVRQNSGFYDSPWIDIPYEGRDGMWGKLLPYQRWQPDNMVVTVLLQRVENPIPLFIRKVESPGFSAREEDGDESGFDLVRGDWLPPYGTGTVADIAFHRSRVVTGVRTNRFRTADWKNPRWVTGKIVSCLYGKIYGDFDPAAAGEPIRVARFLYYLNPTPNDRNLEWDRKTNLNTAERYDLEMLQP